MKDITFIPKAFHKIPITGDPLNVGSKIRTKEDTYIWETGDHPLTPLYPECDDIERNTTLLNAPEKVLYRIHTKNYDTFLPILPICLNQELSSRRALKYNDDKDTVHIRKCSNNGEDEYKWYSALVSYRHPPNEALSPWWEEEQKMWDERIKEAQKYADDELNEGRAVRESVIFNLFYFIDMPLSSGTYEIYYTSCGLESNRVFVEIEIVQ